MSSSSSSSCCSCIPDGFFDSLRFTVCFFLTLSCLLSAGLIEWAVFSIFGNSIFEFGRKYAGSTIRSTKNLANDYFETTVLDSQAIGISIRQQIFADQSSKYLLPSDNSSIDAETYCDIFRQIQTRRGDRSTAYGVFFDDGSIFVAPSLVADNGSSTTTLVTQCVMVASPHSSSSENTSTISRIDYYNSNRSIVQFPHFVPYSAPSNNRTNYPTFYNDAREGHIVDDSIIPYETLYFGTSIALRLSESEGAFLALPATSALRNVSGAFLGILGTAISVDLLSVFLKESIIKKSDNSHAFFIDSHLVIYATTVVGSTLGQQLTINASEQIPTGCVRASDTFLNGANSNDVVCPATVQNFDGFKMLQVFFDAHPKERVFAETVANQNRTDEGVKSIEYPVRVLEEPLVDKDNDVDWLFNEYIVSYVMLSNVGIEFTLGAFFFVPMIDVFSNLILAIGTIAAILGTIGVVMLVIAYYFITIWLLPLESIAQKMAKTARMEFEEDEDDNFDENDQASKEQETNLQEETCHWQPSKWIQPEEIFLLKEAHRNLQRQMKSFCKYLPRGVIVELLNDNLAQAELRRIKKEEEDDCYCRELSSSPLADLGHLPRSVTSSLHRRPCSILCSDIASFSSIAERQDVNRLSQALTYYFDQMIRCLHRCELLLVMMVGDAVIAASGIFEHNSRNHAIKTALCALEMQRATVIHPLKQIFEEELKEKLKMRVGVHTTNGDRVLVGVCGGSNRLAFQILGEDFDFAESLESIGKPLGTRITISEPVREQIKDFTCTRYLLPSSSSHHSGVNMYELVGILPHSRGRKCYSDLVPAEKIQFQPEKIDNPLQFMIEFERLKKKNRNKKNKNKKKNKQNADDDEQHPSNILEELSSSAENSSFSSTTTTSNSFANNNDNNKENDDDETDSESEYDEEEIIQSNPLETIFVGHFNRRLKEFSETEEETKRREMFQQRRISHSKFNRSQNIHSNVLASHKKLTASSAPKNINDKNNASKSFIQNHVLGDSNSENTNSSSSLTNTNSNSSNFSFSSPLFLSSGARAPPPSVTTTLSASSNSLTSNTNISPQNNQTIEKLNDEQQRKKFLRESPSSHLQTANSIDIKPLEHEDKIGDQLPEQQNAKNDDDVIMMSEAISEGDDDDEEDENKNENEEEQERNEKPDIESNQSIVINNNNTSFINNQEATRYDSDDHPLAHEMQELEKAASVSKSNYDTTANDQLRALHEEEDEYLETIKRGTRITARRILRRLESYSLTTNSSVVARKSEIEFCEKYSALARSFVEKKKKNKNDDVNSKDDIEQVKTSSDNTVIDEQEFDEAFGKLKNEYPQFFKDEPIDSTKCLATIINATKSVQKLKEYLMMS